MNILPEEWQAILNKSLSDTFQREQIISGDERLRRLESAVVFTFIVTERMPEIVFTFDADSFCEHE